MNKRITSYVLILVCGWITVTATAETGVHFMPAKVVILPGETVTFDVFVEDTVSAGLGPLKLYQITVPCVASPIGMTSGSVDHDPSPGVPQVSCGNGLSPCIDINNPDWVFAGVAAVDLVNQGDCGAETDPIFTSVVFSASDSQDVTDPKYLGEVAYTASMDASGSFRVDLQAIGDQSWLKTPESVLIPFVVDDPGALIQVVGDADCDGDGIPDAEETDPAEMDCDGDGTCNGDEIANCPPKDPSCADCSGNGVPDGCEADCNSNGAADSCDIMAGTSEDCNLNDIPDECDIAQGGSQDINENGIPDECALIGLTANEAFTASGDKLWRLDLDTGAMQLIGTVASADALSGLSFDPTSGSLFATDLEEIRIISTHNGENRFFGDHGIEPLVEQSGIAIDLFGNIVMVHESTVYSIDRDTGLATPLTVNDFTDASAAAFSPSGALYAIAEFDALDGHKGLVRLDPETGETVSLIGPIVDPDDPEAQFAGQGLDFDGSGTLYMVDSLQDILYTVSLTDATLTFVTDIALTNGSLAIFKRRAGDCDGDGFVTLADLAIFVDCFGGPGVPVRSGCECADADFDGDVDLEDHSIATQMLHECNDYEIDCNESGIADACDILVGNSPDCNGNGVPDECDLASQVSTDCNEDGLPDECAGTFVLFSDDFPDFVGPQQWPLIIDVFPNGIEFVSPPSSMAIDPIIGRADSRRINLSWAPHATLSYFLMVPEQPLGGKLLVEYWDGAFWRPLMSYDGAAKTLPWAFESLALPPAALHHEFHFRFRAILGQPFPNWLVDDVQVAILVDDCNANDVPDECDLSDGSSEDCNTNGIPDECEPDCNDNGIQDDCDISGGVSEDCNANGVPDECEPDCNGNGAADECDIAGGKSADCNGNGVPDECDPDCNNNNSPDECDLTKGTSDDCNGNSVPDECDIAGGESEDCNTNGVPDECEAGCGALIDTVSVGNVGNAANTSLAGPFGAVAYEYGIGVTEVTNTQYAIFLNAIAAVDPHGLYNPNMEASGRGGIIRSGVEGEYSYTIKENFADKPVNFASWIDAARFCNWLHNGQPAGPPDASTTEDGAYDMSIPDPGFNAVRAPGAIWFLPTQDEWYKAAYHDVVNVGADGLATPDYWLYPTMSDVDPTSSTALANGAVANPGPNVVNYGHSQQTHSWNGEGNNVSPVAGCGPSSASFYGTFDQAGNVWEWTEDTFSDPSGDKRVIRGGSLGNGIQPHDLDSNDYPGSRAPTLDEFDIGFRVATIVP